MEIGDRIKNERKKRSISQQQLADYLNISRQAVSRWENNISLPDLNTLVLIAKYFDLKLEYFTEDIILERTEESKEESIEKLKEESKEELEKSEEKNIREKTIEKATPYILVLTAIVTMILLLPSKVKVPILFFGLLFIIFFVSCLLIYYIIKNYLSQN
ncbi:helix-turn-helix transcriptional regulator [Enterococcus faecalis]|nr:helix-turn-helix transcriptional regulator [Enterococcus faecalis]